MHERATMPLPGESARMAEPVVRLVEATKRYRGVTAIDSVDFELLAGEVHGLVGENGAGKSTVCKTLAGAVQLDAGSLEVSGREVTLRRPADSLRLGIAMVYQETSLVPTMTVAQNLGLGHEGVLVSPRRTRRAASQLLQDIGFRIEPTALVASLSAAQRQMVEIARAIRSQAKVVIFDEPTASLTPVETTSLFQVIRTLKDPGVGIIFVSHALEEVLAVTDRVTVLRDGKVQWTRDTQDVSRTDMVRSMVGRDLRVGSAASSTPSLTRTGHAAGRASLVVDNLSWGTIVKNMSFCAYPGEVLGLAGLIGSGRTEALKIVAGALRRSRSGGGRIWLHGSEVRYRQPAQAVRDGIAYITEDRRADGFFETMSAEDNVYLGQLARTGGLIRPTSRSACRTAAAALRELHLRSVNADARVIELSGGNQQKVVVSKSLVQEPDLLIFDEPTRGVDVGAIAQIHEVIRRLAAQGRTVIVISSYLPEILAVSDRILVARQGRIVSEFDPASTTEEELLDAAVH